MRITKIGIPPGGDTNQVLVKSSGTDYDVEWGTGSGSATPPGGVNTQVQFNDGGVFGGDAGFTYNKTTNRLTLGSLVLNDVVDPGVDTDKFLVLTSLGVVSYRNGASVLVDIGGVPTSRTLTINGTSYDLSANRTWSVGTVQSVGLSAPTGFSVANSPVISSGTLALSFASGYSLPTTSSQTNWDTAYTNRITSLTTTGSSGAATLISNTLNIPNYTLSGLGGVPTSRTLTINGTAYDLSADRSWTISSTGVTGSGTQNYIVKWNNAGGTTIGNSVIYDNGTNVGINTTSVSSEKLHVKGNIYIGATAYNGGLYASDGTSSDQNWGFDFTYSGSNDYGTRMKFYPGEGSSRKVGFYDSRNSAWLAYYDGNVNSNPNFVFNIGKVGIGHIPSSGSAKLQVTGNIAVGSTGYNGGYYVSNGTDEDQNWGMDFTSASSTDQSVRLKFFPAAFSTRKLGFYDSKNSVWLGYWDGNVNSNPNFIFNSGNVLIGTTTDSGERLQVSGTAKILGTTTIQPSSGYNAYFQVSGTTLRLNYLNDALSSNVSASFRATDYAWQKGDGSEIMTLSSTGAATFSSSVTAASLTATSSAGLLGNFNSTNANGGYITWQTSGTTIADLGTAQQIFGSGGNDTFGINARGARALTFGTNNTERFRIDSAGAATFSSSVTINGSASQIRSGNELRFYRIDNGIYTQLYDGGNTTGFILDNRNGDGFNFQSAGTSQMRLNADGRLLIGTTTDSGERLQVSGTSKFTDQIKIIGGNTDVLNFKFSSSYGNTNIGVVFDSGSDAGNSLSLKVNNAAGTATERLKLSGNGQLKLNNYTTTSSFSGTPVGLLAFESDGDIITTTLAGAGGIGGSGTTNYIPKFSGSTTIGDSTITDNGTTVELTQGQLRFPATQNASSNVNTLDDYEEGDWTPTYKCSAVNFTSVTYDAVTQGRYVKIGKTVYFNGEMRTDALTKGSAAGALMIGGFPIARADNRDINLTITYAREFLSEYPRAGTNVEGLGTTTDIVLYRTRPNNTTGDAYLTQADVNTGADDNWIVFYGFYRTLN